MWLWILYIYMNFICVYMILNFMTTQWLPEIPFLKAKWELQYYLKFEKKRVMNKKLRKLIFMMKIKFLSEQYSSFFFLIHMSCSVHEGVACVWVVGGFG